MGNKCFEINGVVDGFFRNVWACFSLGQIEMGVVRFWKDDGWLAGVLFDSIL